MPPNTKQRGSVIPLIREDHPQEYNGYPFITLIQHQHDTVLTIIDDSNMQRIRAYVLDLCGPTGVDEELLIETAIGWFETGADKFPFSIELSRRGMTPIVSQIYREYNVEFITRVIGPLPNFNMTAAASVKRRRRKPIPRGVVVRQL